MTWKGTLITLEGANQIFGELGLEFSRDAHLGIYECRGTFLWHDTLQAKTLVELCQKVVSALADVRG